jgi:hypothetical protein
MNREENDQYSDQESERWFKKLVGIALKTPPKTQTMMAGRASRRN